MGQVGLRLALCMCVEVLWDLFIIFFTGFNMASAPMVSLTIGFYDYTMCQLLYFLYFSSRLSFILQQPSSRDREWSSFFSSIYRMLYLKYIHFDNQNPIFKNQEKKYSDELILIMIKYLQQPSVSWDNRSVLGPQYRPE